MSLFEGANSLTPNIVHKVVRWIHFPELYTIPHRLTFHDYHSYAPREHIGHDYSQRTQNGGRNFRDALFQITEGVAVGAPNHRVQTAWTLELTIKPVDGAGSLHLENSAASTFPYCQNLLWCAVRTKREVSTHSGQVRTSPTHWR